MSRDVYNKLTNVQLAAIICRGEIVWFPSNDAYSVATNPLFCTFCSDIAVYTYIYRETYTKNISQVLGSTRMFLKCLTKRYQCIALM